MKLPVQSLLLAHAQRLTSGHARLNSPSLLLAVVISLSMIYGAYAAPSTLSVPSAKNPESVIFEQTQAPSTDENGPETAPVPQYDQNTAPAAENPSEDSSGPSDSSDSSTSATVPPADASQGDAGVSCDLYSCGTNPPPTPDCYSCPAWPREYQKTYCAMTCQQPDSNR
jgi:hypothetical protein